ncbi:MAG: hypothetical protein ACE5FK_08040, partial [Candidatus Methylomirabilia bacterium]
MLTRKIVPIVHKLRGVFVPEQSVRPSSLTPPGLPGPQGLYDPAYEHDACGVGFVVDMKGRK